MVFPHSDFVRPTQKCPGKSSYFRDTKGHQINEVKQQMTAKGQPDPASSQLLQQYCIRHPKGYLDYLDPGVAVEMVRCRTWDCKS